MVARVSEVYVSVQGEGPRVGEPTTFIRFGGCNLRCSGWPCDTQHAVDPAYRREWKRLDTEAIVKQVPEWVTNVCLTGGEPFLQPKDDLHKLVKALVMRGQKVECFSNGTIVYPKWALDMLDFIMDWKLPGSGEDPWDEIRFNNFRKLSVGDAVKFVIKDSADFEVALDIWNKHMKAKYLSGPEVFAGVVWGELDNAVLVQWMLDAKLPWRLNVQVHNHVWDRNKRGI